MVFSIYVLSDPMAPGYLRGGPNGVSARPNRGCQHGPRWCGWGPVGARSHGGGDGDGEISLRTDSPIAPLETYIDRVPSRIRCFLRHVFFPRVDDRSCDIWPSSPWREKHINRELPYRLTCFIS